MLVLAFASLSGAFLLALLIRLARLAYLRGLASPGIPQPRRVLILTAHPDDETMFFAPTILGLLRQKADVYLLCLSSGNYNNQGELRKAELRRACSILGMEAANVTVLEHPKLADHPSRLWPRAPVANIILNWVETLDAETVISFDGGGVSGHRNHVAVFRALQSLYSQGHLPANTAVFVLDTVFLLRKYSGQLPSWVETLDAETVISFDGGGVSGHRNHVAVFRALQSLYSQGRLPANTAVFVLDTVFLLRKYSGQLPSWVETLDAETVISFDGGGVSGHRNHVAVFRALQSLYSQGRLPANTAVFVLDTVFLLRKYSGILDIWWSLWFSNFLYVSNCGGVRRVWRAMREGHQSQMLWFRYLYLLASRYTIINTLRRISGEAMTFPSSPNSSSSSPKTTSPKTTTTSTARRPLNSRPAEL